MLSNCLERGNRRQHELRPKAPCQPAQAARSLSWASWWHGLASGLQALLPELGMAFLDHGEASIDLSQLWLRLYVGQGAVERRAVHLILPVGAVARHVLSFRHTFSALQPASHPAGSQ
jgi:hypothetical protein